MTSEAGYPLFSDHNTTPDQPPAVGPAVSLEIEETEPEVEQAVVSLEIDEPQPEPEQQPVVAAPPATPRAKGSGRLEKSYSSKEVATQFFGKSTQWLYWGMRDEDPDGNPIEPVFSYPDGTPIEPIKIGKGQRRRYTLPIIKEMAAACYRRGNLKEEGHWEAIGKKGNTKVSARGASQQAASAEFRRTYGFEETRVAFVPGLREVIDKIEAAERSELILA